MIFSTPALITAGIFLFLAIAYHLIVRVWLKTNTQHTFAKLVAEVFMVTLIGFMVEKIIEINHKLEKVNEIAETFKFAKVIESIQSRSEENTFRKLLEEVILDTKLKYDQIEHGELNLSREEVIPKWEQLIGKFSTKEIKATNIVSINDWEQFDPSKGIGIHKEAIKRGVKIKRIFIYDETDSLHVKSTNKLAEIQSKLKIEIRIINKKWIDQSPFASEYYRDLGTVDIVIFDNECVLLTMTDNRYNITKGTLTDNPLKMKTANELFNKLWDNGKTYSEFINEKL